MAAEPAETEEPRHGRVLADDESVVGRQRS
jgi:hypothetical protein